MDQLTTESGKLLTVPAATRLKISDYQRLQKRVKQDGTNMSRFIENAILMALDDKKSGINDTRR